MTNRILSTRGVVWLLSIFGLLLRRVQPTRAQDTTTRTLQAMAINPIPVRIDPFHLEVGPTNNDVQSTLSMLDAETILGIVNDLVTNYLSDHYREVDDTDFQYAILSYVEFPSSERRYPVPSATTVLEFSGGIAYMGGYSVAVPSHPEMQLLVELALNDQDLQEAIADYFPFVNRAEFVPDDNLPADNNDSTTTSSGSNDESPPAVTTPTTTKPEADGNAVSPLLSDTIFTGDDTDTEDATDQFIIIVASACAAGVVFCLLMAFLCYLQRQRRKAYWREDVTHMNNTGSSKGEDAALEDLEGEGLATSTNRRGRLSVRGPHKQKSLHLRDSLQDWHDLETVQLPPQKATSASQSDTGSSRRGGILSTAAAAMLPAVCTGDDGDMEKPGVVHRKRSNSTSSCSRSDEDSLPPPGNHQHHGTNVATGDVADDLTCPSDFEGNAVIRPKLVPVPTNMDRFNDDDNNHNADNDIMHIAHEPLPPPSRTPSARRDELPISLNRINSTPSPDAFTTPTKLRSRSSSHDGGGFMAKYIHPITGGVSLPYFGGGSFDGAADGASSNNNNNNYNNYNTSGNKKNTSPRTEATTPDKDVDTDARWSDISSELDIDLGNKTDDEFDNDDTWDPDDASITSSQCGKDVFSPMTASKTNDEIRLLKSTEGLKYNLGKIRASSPSAAGSSRGESPQRKVQARETLLV